MVVPYSLTPRDVKTNTQGPESQDRDQSHRLTNPKPKYKKSAKTKSERAPSEELKTQNEEHDA